jgi:hypothetical protein
MANYERITAVHIERILNMGDNPYQDLLYRRQFFFGLNPFGGEKWRTFPMPGGFYLSTHPELKVTRLERGAYQAALLGFMLDPYHTSDRNEQILTRLCDSAKSIPDLIKLTELLGGRWLLFLYQDDERVVFNDPCGMRTVFYHFDTDGNPWLASQPGLLGRVLQFKTAEEGFRFMQSPGFVRRLEAWWPGDSSPYAEVKHLLPNHLLNLKRKSVERFWPNRRLKTHSLEDGVKVASEIIKGTVASAHHRYPLAVSLSSGYDSRLVLSTCKDFASDVFIFSMMYRKLTHESDDIRIPREITKSLGLKHYLVDARSPMSNEFEEIYRENVLGIRNDWGNIIEERLKQVPGDRLVMKGSNSEIVRCRYWPHGTYPYRVTVRDIVRLMNLGDDPLVIRELTEWMADAISVEKHGYKLLDMLSWENEIGNWMGMAPLIFDLSQEEFSPFSNRALLNTMLGVNPVYRSFPEHKMERMMVSYLWSDLAAFPYTPSRRIPEKPFLDGPVFNALRWGKYILKGKKRNRLTY